jgi:hypothetical protein
MGVLLGRGDWPPCFRIESLRRYAFIGDSHTYGSGVAPNQTLGANAERQLNALLPAWPVECVNLGVAGHNLWNSWLAFKELPQVYDGVVLALCNNDADLFGRTYQLVYASLDPTRWERNHPFGELIARGFDDIAAFSREQSLPIAVVYYSAYGGRDQVRIGEIVRDLCASRGLCFIDTLAHYRDRNLALADLVVSAADGHPSALAHEAVGRHLAATLKRQGWFRAYEEPAISVVPERILAAARAMVEIDHYPPDVALHWALRALDIKSRLAHRMQASGDDFSAGFASAAAPVTEALTAATHRWHVANRTRALVGNVTTGGLGVVWGLTCIQELKLQLDELGFALGTANWTRLKEILLESELLRQVALAVWPSEAEGFLDGCNLELSRLRDALAELRSLAVPATVGSPYGEALMLADLEVLARLVDRTQSECGTLKAAFLRIEATLNDSSEEDIAQVSGVVGTSFERVRRAGVFLANWTAALKRIRDTNHAPFTTIEVTISGTIEGRPLGIVGVTVEYSVPNRLPISDAGSFRFDGSATLIKLHFPIFYAGRVRLRSFVPKNTQMVETSLVKVEIYNRPNQRRIVDPASFYREPDGRYFSPFIYLS